MNFTRRSFFQYAATGLAVANRQLPASQRRPNVLLVTSDQETSLLPGSVNLPNRQKLRDRGVTFQYAFCNTPQCSPGRAALMTGLTPFHAKVVTNVNPGSLGLPLSPELPTLGSVFQSAGYSTGYFGKWHLGENGPEKFGFGKAEIGFPQNSAARSDTPVTQAAADWIRGQKGPWMAWVSLINPHDIYFPLNGFGAVEVRSGVRPPFSGSENLDGKPAEQKEYAFHVRDKNSAGIFNRTAPPKQDDWLRYRSYYCDLVENIDKCLGIILASVPDLDSTVVAYTSDHGDELGEHGLPFKGPFMYEEVIRIPLTIAAPGSALGRGIRQEFATEADMLPTLASLAGISAPSGLDGIDLSRKGTLRDAVFLEYAGKQQTITPIRTIRTKQWKLNWYDSGGKELYDIEADPHELRNLAGTPKAAPVQATLESRLSAWRPSLTELEKQTPGRYLKPARSHGERPAGS